MLERHEHAAEEISTLGNESARVAVQSQTAACTDCTDACNCRSLVTRKRMPGQSQLVTLDRKLLVWGRPPQ